MITDGQRREELHRQRPSRKVRFSLACLLIAIAAVSLYFALPGGVIVATTLIGWILVGLLAIGVLMILQAPFNLLLKRRRTRSQNNSSNR
jgi:hypothetical protein